MAINQELIEKLEAAHTFPSPYTFRIIGLNLPNYESSILEALNHLQVKKVSERYSENRKHLSLTLQINAERPQVVLETYEMLAKLPNVKYVL